MISKIHLVVLVALASSLAAWSGKDRPKHADVGARKTQESDNTARNVPDRDDTIPAIGGSEADVAITQNIRQIITATGSLSVNAKNIKISTLNGVVTLRGPVEDNQEKEYIASVAKTTAGVSRIDNQLEVAGH